MFTEDQIKEILRTEKFPYHRVELPYGLATPGQDRSATREVIFPESLAGKSVLDVGCALGFFCFEAEKKGATRVVGVELDPERFRQAGRLKEILDSKVEFMQRDLLDFPAGEQFDYVCFLNVIHHLNEPARAIQQLSALTRERLIIEFPTFADEKYRQQTGIVDSAPYDRLPLIGVTSRLQTVQRPGGGQTFVFSPAAMEMMLLDHRPLFSRVQIVDSPMTARKIALCDK